MKDKKKKILIIRLGAIGDVVHTTIIPKSIKNSHPDYEIHYLTQAENIPLLENCDFIDKIHLWDRNKRKSFKYLIETSKILFKERYDIVFNLTNAIRNYLLSIFAFPKQIVTRKRTKGLWVEDYFYTAKSVIKDITIPERLYLGINNELNREITERLSNYPKPYTMIIPGGGTDKNRQGRIWDINNWKNLTQEILKKYGGTIFVCGGKNERPHHEILLNDNIVITTGEYNLAGTSALLSHANLVISGDTGPLHIASAHNVKTLALIGSTSPDKIKPYGKNGHYISANTDCKFCWKKRCKHLNLDDKITPCMANITVNMVMDKIEQENLL